MVAADTEARATQGGLWPALGVLFVAHAAGWGGAAAFVLSRLDWVGGGSGGSGGADTLVLFGWLLTWLVAGGVVAGRLVGVGVRRGLLSVGALVVGLLAGALAAGLAWELASQWGVVRDLLSGPSLGPGLAAQLVVLLPRRSAWFVVGRVGIPVLVDLAARGLGRGNELDIAGGPAGAFVWLGVALALVGVLERSAGRP